MAQWIARLPPKEKVAGSNPVSDILFFQMLRFRIRLVLSSENVYLPRSLVGQDMWFSPTRPGFESRRGNIFFCSIFGVFVEAKKCSPWGSNP